MPLRRALPAILASLLLTTPLHAMDERFQIVDDGNAILDRQTQLIWARCLVGMTWNGSTCEGEAQLIDLRSALARWPGSGEWRVPSFDELMGITRQYQVPPVDMDAFPNSPPIGVWTSSAYARTEDRAQYISYANGVEYFDYRGEKHAIRLVRNSSSR